MIKIMQSSLILVQILPDFYGILYPCILRQRNHVHVLYIYHAERVCPYVHVQYMYMYMYLVHSTIYNVCD